MSRENTQGKNKLTGSTFAKILAYFLLAISFLVGGVATVVTVYLAVGEVYTYGDSRFGLENIVKEGIRSIAQSDMADFYYLKWPEEEQELESLLEEFCEGKNIQLEVYEQNITREGEQELILSNYDGFDTPYSFSRIFREYEEVVQAEKKSDIIEVPAEVPAGDNTGEVEVPESNVLPLEDEFSDEKYIIVEENASDNVEEILVEEIQYRILAYVNPGFSVYDEYTVVYEQIQVVWNYRNVFPIVALVCILICFICFIFLMCAAGHKNGQEGIVTGILTPIHFDVLTAVFGFVAFMGLFVGVQSAANWGETWIGLSLIVLVGMVEVVWCTIYCAEAALRFKLGKWWKHSLIYIVFRMLYRGIRFLGNAFVTLMRGLPLIGKTLFICCGICFVELMLMVLWGYDSIFSIWILEKVILIPVVLYIALVCKKLQEGSKALAEGNLSYKLDTTKMLLDFKEHGENLNQIGLGISKAVEARMKSKHLKTELITNVSHDIKTPLTSIINYADLLGNVAKDEKHMDQGKVAEYSEVLLRQSRRLKKLLEDLVEASKATTGNIEVKMEKCEVGVLLSQAVGEYESRFWEKQLELITKQPQEPVWIMADGRRLWRVFDNLLNNVCKYAQESTRVYISVEPKDGKVEIIFRNMSKYPLDLTGEELEERFVRGDKSRHMEGNGLGLSIAKSLVELQNGSMEIVTDGDLFKVVLKFAVL